MTLAEHQQALIEELEIVPGYHERMTVLVDRAAKAPKLAPEEKTDASRVPGCVASVWLAGSIEDGLCQFHAESDAPMVHAMAVVLCRIYSGFPPEEVIREEEEFFEKTGILRVLSPTRVNGLKALRARIRAIAEAEAQ